MVLSQVADIRKLAAVVAVINTGLASIVLFYIYVSTNVHNFLAPRFSHLDGFPSIYICI
jgi:hypothetical protein